MVRLCCAVFACFSVVLATCAFAFEQFALQESQPFQSLPTHYQDQGVRDSIIKIYTSFNQYDHQNPWANLGPRQKHGSGAIIQLPEQQAVLTNSHVISAHTYIEGRKNGRMERYKLKPLWVSQELDLALLVPFHDHEKAAFFCWYRAYPLGGAYRPCRPI